jgi:hypothetical protein
MSMQINIQEIILKRIIDDISPIVLLIDELQQLGYNQAFELSGTILICRKNGQAYQQIELMVDEFFVLEDTSISEKEFKIFAVRHRSENLKGIFIGI